MGSIVVAAATGQGTQALGVSTGVVDITWRVDTAGPLVKKSGHIRPYRLFGAGWIGVGYLVDGSDGPYVSWDHYLDVEQRRYIVGARAFYAYADTIFWDLSSGTIVHIEVDW